MLQNNTHIFIESKTVRIDKNNPVFCHEVIKRQELVINVDYLPKQYLLYIFSDNQGNHKCGYICHLKFLRIIAMRYFELVSTVGLMNIKVHRYFHVPCAISTIIYGTWNFLCTLCYYERECPEISMYRITTYKKRYMEMPLYRLHLPLYILHSNNDLMWFEMLSVYTNLMDVTIKYVV